jgi:hypothetical protein
MQPVRVYQEFFPSTPSQRVGPCGLHVFLEWASSLADSGYAKSEDPRGHALVTWSWANALMNIEVKLDTHPKYC